MEKSPGVSRGIFVYLRVGTGRRALLPASAVFYLLFSALPGGGGPGGAPPG